MKLDRIPARMLLVLGLGPGCGPAIDEVDTTAAESGDGESTRGSTSGMTATSSSTTPNPGTSTGDLSTSACLDVGTCLSEDVGPCLAPEPPETTSSGDDTGMSSDTLGPCLDIDPTSGSGSSDGSTGGSSDTGTIEPCLSPPGDAPAPDGPAALAPSGARSTHVLDRVLSSGRLPEDVAERLKRRR